MPDPTPTPHPPWRLSTWVTMAIVILLAIPLTLAGYRFAEETQQKTAVVDQMKRLAMTLKIFANDNCGIYPFMDPRWPTANAGFNLLAQEDILLNEADLGALASPFKPDGDMGSLPGCDRAAQPGECHWMVIKNSTTSNSGDEPLIFDNALKAEWPPRWRANADGQPVRGRTLFGGKIVIAFNDNTVRFIKLVPASHDPGADLVLPTLPTPWFHPMRGTVQVSDIEEKPGSSVQPN